jgi:hypothetical protein
MLKRIILAIRYPGYAAGLRPHISPARECHLTTPSHTVVARDGASVTHVRHDGRCTVTRVAPGGLTAARVGVV